MPKIDKQDALIAKETAEAHVDWFLTLIRPLLITYSVHFFKHGQEYERERKGE